MGSIVHIKSNPSTWTVYDSGKRCKEEYGGEKLLTVRYGTFDDDPDGPCDMEMYMRESVYQKLIDGDYVVSAESKFKHRLIILDCKTSKIVPSLGGTIY